MRKLTIVLTLALAAVSLTATAASAADHEAIFEAVIEEEVSPGVFEVRAIAYAVSCPEGETFLGRINVRYDGEVIFIAKIGDDCQPIGSLRNTLRGRQFGTFPCGATLEVSSQVRSSDGARFKFPKATVQLSC